MSQHPSPCSSMEHPVVPRKISDTPCESSCVKPLSSSTTTASHTHAHLLNHVVSSRAGPPDLSKMRTKIVPAQSPFAYPRPTHEVVCVACGARCVGVGVGGGCVCGGCGRRYQKARPPRLHASVTSKENRENFPIILESEWP